MSGLEQNPEEPKGEKEERRGNGRYNLRPLARLAYGPIVLGKRGNGWGTNVRRSKLRKKPEYSDLWNNFPFDAYCNVTMRLPLPDYLTMRRVCTEWSRFTKASSQAYLKQIVPLAMSIKNVGKKKISFYNMVQDRTCSTKVMYYCRKLYQGISQGFIVMENAEGIWLANPVTGQQFEFIKPPGAVFTLSDRVILTKAVPSNGYILIVLHRFTRTLYVSRAGSGNWILYSYSDQKWDLVDLITFRGFLVGLTNIGLCGTMELSDSLKFKTWRQLQTQRFSQRAKLAVSVDNVLMAVDVSFAGKYMSFKLAGLKWTPVPHMENQALFVDPSNNLTFCDPRGWGGATNCVYMLTHSFCSVISLADGHLVQEYCIRLRTRGDLRSIHYTMYSQVCGWYFPQLVDEVAQIRDDMVRSFPGNDVVPVPDGNPPAIRSVHPFCCSLFIPGIST